jgi:hypothetical protein
MQVVTSAPQIKQAILDSASATPTASLATNTVTGGRLNVSRFLSATVPNPPAAPANLIASAVSSSQINLTWTDQSANENGFRVERCAGASCTAFTQIASLSAEHHVVPEHRSDREYDLSLSRDRLQRRWQLQPFGNRGGDHDGGRDDTSASHRPRGDTWTRGWTNHSDVE